MYDPRQPTDWKAEAKKGNIQWVPASLSSSPNHPPSTYEAERQVSDLLYSSSQVSAEALYRKRLLLSAKAGVESAQVMQKQIAAADVMSRQAQATNTSSLVKRKIAEMTGGDKDEQLPNRLVFGASQDGTHTVSSVEQKRAVKGTPSSVIAVEVDTSNVQGISADGLVTSLKHQCAHFGHVMQVKAAELKGRKLLRCCVKFDTVASAFAAGEELLKNTSFVTVAYFPKKDFEGGNLTVELMK